MKVKITRHEKYSSSISEKIDEITTNKSVNPYKKYSYNSGMELRNDWTGTRSPVWGTDLDWMLWQLEHGEPLGSLSSEEPEPPEITYKKESIFDIFFH